MARFHIVTTHVFLLSRDCLIAWAQQNIWISSVFQSDLQTKFATLSHQFLLTMRHVWEWKQALTRTPLAGKNSTGRLSDKWSVDSESARYILQQLVRGQLFGSKIFSPAERHQVSFTSNSSAISPAAEGDDLRSLRQWQSGPYSEPAHVSPALLQLAAGFDASRGHAGLHRAVVTDQLAAWIGTRLFRIGSSPSLCLDRAESRRKKWNLSIFEEDSFNKFPSW